MEYEKYEKYILSTRRACIILMFRRLKSRFTICTFYLVNYVQGTQNLIPNLIFASEIQTDETPKINFISNTENRRFTVEQKIKIPFR